MNGNLLRIVISSVIICLGCCERPTISLPRPEEFIFYPDYPEELVVPQWTSFHLRCEHSSPVNWSFTSSFTSQLESDQDTRELQPLAVNLGTYMNRSSRLHVAELEIINPSRQETGYFYCKNMFATSNLDPQNSANVYVYVKDPKNLFVHADDEFCMKHLLQYRAATLHECRTSSPDVDVTLMVNDDAFVDGGEHSFDPRVGYHVKHVHLRDQSYKCVGKRKEDGFEQEIECEITVLPHRDFVPKPQINSSVLHAGAGSSLTLQCLIVVDIDVLFQLYWVAPSGISQDRISDNNTKAWSTTDTNNEPKRVGSVKLTISDTRPSDSGEFKCVVTDHANNTEFTTKNVTIFR